MRLFPDDRMWIAAGGIGIAADDGTRLVSTCGDVGRSHWWAADDEQTVTGCAQNLKLTKSCLKPSSDSPFPNFNCPLFDPPVNFQSI